MRPSPKFFLPLLLAPALWAGSADAATSNCLLSSLTGNPTACNIILDNVQFSNFTYSGFTASATDQFVLEGDSSGSGRVQLDFIDDRSTSVSGTFGYTATLLGPPIRAFNNAEARLSASTLGGGTASSTYSSSGLSPLTTDGSPADGTFQQNLTTQTFTQTFSFNQVAVSNRLRSVEGVWDTYEPVPGPLPLLGAATAFGLSRKIRSRIRSAA